MNKRAKEIEALFGNEILSRAKELNLSNRFTDPQVELIEETVDHLLRVGGQEEQIDFISALNLETSLLLCTWFIRGGQQFYRDSICLSA